MSESKVRPIPPDIAASAHINEQQYQELYRRSLAEPDAFTLARLGALAADALCRAVARAVFAAEAWPGAAATTWRSLA